MVFGPSDAARAHRGVRAGGRVEALLPGRCARRTACWTAGRGGRGHRPRVPPALTLRPRGPASVDALAAGRAAAPPLTGVWASERSLQHRATAPPTRIAVAAESTSMCTKLWRPMRVPARGRSGGPARSHEAVAHEVRASGPLADPVADILGHARGVRREHAHSAVPRASRRVGGREHEHAHPRRPAEAGEDGGHVENARPRRAVTEGHVEERDPSDHCRPRRRGAAESPAPAPPRAGRTARDRSAPRRGSSRRTAARRDRLPG